MDHLLVNADDPDDIAAAISELPDNDAFAERLSVMGRAGCEQQSVDKLLPAYEAFYRSCIAGFPQRGIRAAPPKSTVDEPSSHCAGQTREQASQANHRWTVHRGTE